MRAITSTLSSQFERSENRKAKYLVAMSNGAATRGMLLKKGGYLMTTWQKRWFHLEGGTLYWSGQRDDEPGTKGSGVLTAAYLHVPEGGADLHVEMKHATKKKVKYVLRAANSDEAAAWCDKMNFAIAETAAAKAKEIAPQ